MGSSSTRRVVAVLLIGVLVVLWPGLKRTAEVALAVADIAGQPFPAWLDRRPPAVSTSLSLEPGGPVGRMDLYRAGPSPDAALLLLHGLTPRGKDDARLAMFARQLARAGFLVAVPHLPTLARRQLRTETVDEIAQTLGVLDRLRAGTRTRRAGLAAISVAAGPAILALRDARRDVRPDFLVTVGAYYDLLRTLRFQMTGEYDHGGTRLSRHPNVHARWAFVLSELDRITDPGDRRALAGLAERRMAAPEAGAGPTGVGPALGPEGRAVLAFVENEHPARFRELFANLPRAVRSGVRALDLASADLAGVDLPALLVHGRDDPVVPFPETRDLARALQVPDSRAFLIDGLGHVSDPGLRDALGLWRTVHALLRLRDASP